MKKTLLGVLVTGVIVLAAALSPRIVSTVHALPPAQDPDRPGLTVPDSGPPAPEGNTAASGSRQAFAAESVTASTHLGSEIVISALSNKQHLPAVAYNSKDKEYLVLWHNEWGGGGTDIYAQRVTEAGELKSWFAVTGPPAPGVTQQNPDVVYNRKQNEYLVAWEYYDGVTVTRPNILARRVSANGHLLGSEITLGTGAALRIRSQPAVAYAYTSNNYAVVWTSFVWQGIGDDIEGQMVSANGSPVGNNFILAQDGWLATHDQPDVTYNLARNEYLVVWERFDTVDYDVYGLRLQGNGNVLGGGEFPITTWADDERYPAAAACDAANQYMVVWQSLQSPGDYDIYGRFIKGDGTPDSVHHFPGTSVAEQRPAIACNAAGQHYLAVWEQQYSNLTGPFGIFGQDVSPDKTVGTEFGIMAPTGGVTAEFTNPAVAGGGATYLVVWEHDRAGTTFQDIHGRLIALNALFLPMTKRAAP